MGWNTKDPISQMDPLYAVEMENFFPDNGTVTLRKGTQYHVSACGTVYGMGTYTRSTGTNYLLSAEVYINKIIKIYNSSTGSAPAVDITGAATWTAGSGPMQTVNFRDKIFLKDASATGDVYWWQGAGNITAAAFTGPGGDDKDLMCPFAYKGRLYFAQFTAPVLWYAGFNSITGALASFDLSSILTLGGRIVYVGSITSNSSDIQEAMLLISDKGEVLVYQGNNPGDVTWSIIGHYYIPLPCSIKSFFKWGQDVLVITNQGLVSISQVMSQGVRGQYEFISDKIQSAFISAVAGQYITPTYGYSSFTFINGVIYPKGNMLICNVGEGLTSTTQFVMNLVTGAWCKFTGMIAFEWIVFNDSLYYGSDQVVMLADTGYTDRSEDTSGTAKAKTIKLRHAFNYLGNNIANKQFTMAIPTIYQSEGLSLTLDCDVDYTDVTATSTETDTTDTAYKLYQPRMGLINQVNGSAVSIRIDGTCTTKRISLQATKVFWNEGNTD
jgi:hypothetical protein